LKATLLSLTQELKRQWIFVPGEFTMYAPRGNHSLNLTYHIRSGSPENREKRGEKTESPKTEEHAGLVMVKNTLETRLWQQYHRILEE
jgi:hypothetical protein